MFPGTVFPDPGSITIEGLTLSWNAPVCLNNIEPMGYDDVEFFEDQSTGCPEDFECDGYMAQQTDYCTYYDNDGALRSGLFNPFDSCCGLN